MDFSTAFDNDDHDLMTRCYCKYTYGREVASLVTEILIPVENANYSKIYQMYLHVTPNMVESANSFVDGSYIIPYSFVECGVRGYFLRKLT